MLLLLLVSVDPYAPINVELVARKQHPATFTNELDRTDDVVNLLVREVKRNVESSEAHPHELLAVE